MRKTNLMSFAPMASFVSCLSLSDWIWRIFLLMSSWRSGLSASFNESDSLRAIFAAKRSATKSKTSSITCCLNLTKYRALPSTIAEQLLLRCRTGCWSNDLIVAQAIDIVDAVQIDNILSSCRLYYNFSKPKLQTSLIFLTL